MTNVEYETGVLVREIRRSNEYNQYQRLRKKLGADPELMRRINEYRKKSFYLQTKEYEESDLSWLDELESENEDILSMPQVREYLLSEQKLCRMLRKILQAVTKAGDIDIDL